MAKEIQADNAEVFRLISGYLNNVPDYVKQSDMEEIVGCGVTSEYGFASILAAGFGLDIIDNPTDKELFNNYFMRMFHKLDPDDFTNNPYYNQIKIPEITIGNSKLTHETYAAYEGFVCNDIVVTKEGRQLPQVGFFETEFRYPAVLENNRLWMSITPNEIITMETAVDQAFGRVLTYGLGLGYYTYMVSEKTNVSSVTVVENNADVIKLFEQYILPQFKQREKIEIIHADAFEYAAQNMADQRYDFVFTDLWHDVSDGIELYLRMKEYEQFNPNTIFSYWIEKSILCYL